MNVTQCLLHTEYSVQSWELHHKWMQPLLNKYSEFNLDFYYYPGRCNFSKRL